MRTRSAIVSSFLNVGQITRTWMVIGATLIWCINWIGNGSLRADDGAIADGSDKQPNIKTLPGFEVELVYSVPKSEGSWVSLAVEKPGRLVASDQYGRLYRITPGDTAADTKVEPLLAKIGRAQGLLYAFDSLYVMAHAGDDQPAGLYRLRDTDADDQYDKVELILPLDGGGEHGPHAIVRSPDGQSLYICAGNHTKPPAFQTTALPATWEEDQVIPRQWDAGGHAVGIMAPGGWIAKVDPEGKSVRLVAAGFRNEYDIAFSAQGELFTYDADMEWDVGAPWYRPTRVNHVVSGAEFGWRSGTGKWPAYYPDSLGSVIDIGPGSPTGVTFGTGAKYPAKYQNAMYIADWSYGIIYALHLKPSGASYTAESELFCSAPAMQVADMVINPSDRLLYYVVGGRRTQSSLYRVHYRGTESVEFARPAPRTREQEERLLLENLWHSNMGEFAVDSIWKYLANPDRHLRYAARIALEHQPTETWKPRLSQTQDTQTTLEMCLAAVRCRVPDCKPIVMGQLSALNWDELSVEQRLHLLRVYGLASVRLSDFSAEDWQTVIAHVGQRFPNGHVHTDLELARLLTAAKHPAATATMVQLLRAAPSQEEQIHYAYCLAYATTGWAPELREDYFRWFVDSANLRGGHSFGGFLANIRKQAVESLDWNAMDAQATKSLEAVLELKPTETNPIAELEARPVVKKWSMADLISKVDAPLTGRDFENGKKMFAVTQCFKCHRFDGTGGIVGPDLSAVRRRFSKHDLLESLLEPSKVVSDQYQATMFQLADGRTVTGRVVNLNGDQYMVQEDMLNPGRLTTIKVEEIEEMKASEISMMPSGLLDTLTEDDILDLIAYLRSGGDRTFSEVAPR
ncbi:MAG: c-type cytochrome [Planctomycetaceae bacterium]|nr:c-type cytochrome [Planctomycetaceae bacterium]